jgi:hypothetical protein
MKPVGGYFELELGMGGCAYHETPHTFKSGRSALHYILNVCRPSLVYVPYYTCNAMLQSFEAANVPFVFYAINEALEPVSLPTLQNGQYFLYINYFDIKGNVVYGLSEIYGNRLIVDCTQAFFTKGNGRSWFFNSCRKFFGVPDGAFVYGPDEINLPAVESNNEMYTLEHLVKRFNGHTREGYAAFQQNEIYCGAAITGMSTITRHLLSNINYEAVIEKRRANFNYLHQVFKHTNRLPVTANDDSVPMVYPLLPAGTVNRQALYNSNLFIPTFWTEIITGDESGYTVEQRLAEKLLPLPVDHRYGINDMKRMATFIQSML